MSRPILLRTPLLAIFPTPTVLSTNRHKIRRPTILATFSMLTHLRITVNHVYQPILGGIWSGANTVHVIS